MPYLSRRVLVSLCPLVNLDLFKRGHYHLACQLTDDHADSLLSKVTCSAIKDLFGPGLSDHAFPGATIAGRRFVTQTVSVEYSDQTFMLGECFVFQYDSPFLADHTEAYIPSHLTLHLHLMHYGEEEPPSSPDQFTQVSSRTVAMEIDWRKGLHDHCPVIFDYFHMAAVGVTVHASLHGISPDDFSLERPPPSNRRWSLFPPPSPPPLPSLASILFGALPPPSSRQEAYEVPKRHIQRAQDAHQMLCDVLCSARDSLYIGYAIMSGERSEADSVPPVAPLTTTSTLRGAEELFREQVSLLNARLASSWEWFCSSAVVHPGMIQFLASRAHKTSLSFMRESVVSPDTSRFKSVANIADPVCQAAVAGRVRRCLQVPFLLYCRESTDTQTTASVLFVEPSPWETRLEVAWRMLARQSEATPPREAGQVQPYFLNLFPQTERRRRPGVHLVVCVHGLQGNQFDLRLYRVFLQLSCPQTRIEFLMAQANQRDTFCDFNLMTSQLLHEVLSHLHAMPSPPARISFIGHSLGAIVIRSLITRSEFAPYHSKLHLFLSICGPHLGTRFQTGIVSMGMWAVRKWYSSKSLLQLSLKDSAEPRDSFLYHLSESPSLEPFRHVVLLCSPQDKYVPYQSAKLASIVHDGSLQSTLSLEMMQNIVRPLREAKVNLVRVSVDHAIPASTNSVIGRAAHIAMLDSELFIEKFVVTHLAQYFLEP